MSEGVRGGRFVASGERLVASGERENLYRARFSRADDNPAERRLPAGWPDGILPSVHVASLLPSHHVAAGSCQASRQYGGAPSGAATGPLAARRSPLALRRREASA